MQPGCTQARGCRGVLRIVDDARGTAVLEFALVSAPFFALIVAILQITTVFFAQQALETASEKAVRQLLTGSAQKAGMTQAQFKTAVCSKLPAFMKCANVIVDVRTVSQFSDATFTQPTITYDSSGNPSASTQFAPGQGGEITMATISYVWGVQSGPLGVDVSNMAGGGRLLNAICVFKTEPFA